MISSAAHKLFLSIIVNCDKEDSYFIVVRKTFAKIKENTNRICVTAYLIFSLNDIILKNVFLFREKYYTIATKIVKDLQIRIEDYKFYDCQNLGDINGNIN